MAEAIQTYPEIAEGLIFKHNETFLLESGKHLLKLKLCYSTYGKLNDDKSNVVWVCHALTGNANVTDWWKELFGENKLYDYSQYFIVCANVPGSCYGSIGPLDINEETNEPYFYDFPAITIRDVVNAFEMLKSHLGIEKIHTCIGGSLGGQQALEWAVSYPDTIENLVLMATNARTSPWGVALNETQRMAIRTDITWGQRHEEAGLEGMKVARAMALLSYRSYETYEHTQKDMQDAMFDLKAITYQQHQGNKFKKRFNAFSYWAMTLLLDSHNVGRNRGGVSAALKKINAKTLIIGISTDVLFPTKEQEYLHKHIKNSRLEIIESLYGHDGFLIETEKIQSIIQNFYNS